MCWTEELDLTYYFYSFSGDCVECNCLSHLNSLWPLLALELRTQAIPGTGLFIRLLFIWMESRCAPEDDIQAV